MMECLAEIILLAFFVSWLIALYWYSQYLLTVRKNTWLGQDIKDLKELLDYHNDLLSKKNSWYSEYDMYELLDICMKSSVLGTSSYISQKGIEFIKSRKKQ